jgi:hypothetical protein
MVEKKQSRFNYKWLNVVLGKIDTIEQELVDLNQTVILIRKELDNIQQKLKDNEQKSTNN